MKKIITFENILKWAESKSGLTYIICISVMLKAFLFASDSLVNNDGLVYISAAQEFAAGHFKECLAIFPMPFYPMLIGIVHFLIPDWVAAARVLSILFIVFALIPLYLITEELFDKKAAFWACLAFTLAPFPNSLADSVIRDPGFIFCSVWAVYFALRSTQSPRIILFAATAFFSWVSILFRIEGIMLILFFPAYFLVLSYMKNQERAPLLKGALLFVVIPLLLVTVFSVYSFNDTVSFNRSDYIYAEFQKLFKIEFLDNYYTLSEQLEILVQSSPFPGYRNNFAEIARHYIPVIYLFGFIETFIVVLYPLFVIPLIFSFKDSIRKNRVFVLSVFWAFILMDYYFLIRMDFLTSRYISVPVLLMYPWVGAGIQKIFEYLSMKFSKKVFAAIFILFFILPVYQCIEQEWKQDNSLIVASKWTANNTKDNNLRIITTDKRFLFYAGRDFRVGDGSLGTNSDGFYSLKNKDDSYNELEQFAILNQFDLIMLRISSKAKEPQFEHLKKLKEFKGSKNISYVFSSPEVADKIGSK
ncbi:MAG: glycosyltransferase family 39 protein [Pseudomonadota bacterium]